MSAKRNAECDLLALSGLLDGIEVGFEFAHGRDFDGPQGDYKRGVRDALMAVQSFLEEPTVAFRVVAGHYADDHPATTSPTPASPPLAERNEA